MRIEEMGMLDAFCALNDVDDSDLPKIREGKSFDVRNTVAMDAAKAFRDNHNADDTLEVIDVNADDMDHLLDKKEYVGQVILSCKKCHAKKFIDMDQLVKSGMDEKGNDLYNVDDECPSCHIEGKGYELIGQVGKVEPEMKIEPEAVDQEVVPEEQEPEPLPDSEVATDTDTVATDLPEFEGDEEPAEEKPVEEEPVEEPEVDNKIDDDEKDGMETDTQEDDDEESDLGEVYEENPVDDDKSENYFKDFDGLADKGFNDDIL